MDLRGKCDRGLSSICALTTEAISPEITAAARAKRIAMNEAECDRASEWRTSGLTVGGRLKQCELSEMAILRVYIPVN